MSENTGKFDISYVAHLARLELSDEEKQQFSTQLKDILAYVDKLGELDVAGVEPTAHAVPLTNVLRADVARPSIAREKILRNAPQQAQELFIMPKIVE
jgi:aspartyl-tRNA(Asn)/glutamyl-tRNA(Gln) amidotransferase subunit C